MATIASTESHRVTTVIALRRSSIRRRSARSCGRAMPFSSSRSVGRTSGRAAGSVTIVVVATRRYITLLARLMRTRNRPLTARSVLASTLLGADPPELPVSHLVYVADLFGINENSARVALSRMAASGEVVTSGSGRYRLVGHLLERQQRQLLSRAGRTGEWSGSWHMVALTTTATADVRGQRRRSLTAARLAELRQGLWLRPDNLALELGSDLRDEATAFSARPEDDRVELAASLWDLGAWASAARGLLRELRELTPKGPDDLAPGFVRGAA